MTHRTPDNSKSAYRQFCRALGTWIGTVAALAVSHHGRIALWWTYRDIAKHRARACGLLRVELMGGPLDGRRVRWRIRRHGYVRRFPLRFADDAWRCCTEDEAEIVSVYNVLTDHADHADHLLDAVRKPRRTEGARAHG